QRTVQEGMVYASAEGAHEHQRGRTALQRLADREFAIGAVLVLRIAALGDLGKFLDGTGSGRIEVADPEFGSDPESLCMVHAGVRRYDARTGDLSIEARRAHQLSAEEDDECAHGVALTTRHVGNG